MKTKERIEKRVLSTCDRLGFGQESFGYKRGDYWKREILDIVYKPKDLKRFHASGRFLALVRRDRKRVYARSYGHGPHYSDFFHLIGENENGQPFSHPVPQVDTVEDAILWIWDSVDIDQRQGEVAIAPCRLKKVKGEEKEFHITNDHYVFGEVFQNGGLYARHAFIYHTRGQHRAIYIGRDWKRIVVAKRSERGLASAD